MKTLDDLAKCIIDLSYVDMTELGDAFASTAKNDKEEGNEFDATDRDQWCEMLRWWAVGHIDAMEDAQ